MLTAGVAMPLKEGKTLDFAWRYSDLEKFGTGQGEGRVIWRDGSRDPRQLNLAQTRAEAENSWHQAFCALRVLRRRLKAFFGPENPSQEMPVQIVGVLLQERGGPDLVQRSSQISGCRLH